MLAPFDLNLRVASFYGKIFHGARGEDQLVCYVERDRKFIYEID